MTIRFQWSRHPERSEGPPSLVRQRCHLGIQKSLAATLLTMTAGKIPFRLTALALCVASLPPVYAQAAPSTAQDDALLHAMQAELAREKELLVLPGLQRPYFMEYRLEDIESYNAVANYGALAREDSSHQRVVRVEVRVGDYRTDSSSSRGEGSLALAPTDNDPATLRYALWSATDEAYKAALKNYAAKQAALKHFQTPPNANDFTPAAPVTLLEPAQHIELDREQWKRRLAEASGLFRTDPRVKGFADTVQYSSATLNAVAATRTLVNTDGAAVRHGYSAYSAGISVGGQADDGMQLGRDNGSTATSASGLESEAALRERVVRDLQSYNDLRHAPVFAGEDYHGPVLFSGDAAADVVRKMFLPNIEADRPEMGTTARTVGMYQSSLGSRVLPEFLSVRDEPELRTFEGHSLVGAYPVDDEGVRAETVEIVRDGRLENFLLGREPIKDFPHSNGHGRAALGQAAHSHAGVLVVTAAQPLSTEALRDKLLAEAKHDGHDVYEVETLVGDLQPRVLYRISPDGKRTLVRGAAFDELDGRSLRNEVIAAGKDPYVAQTLGPIPQSVIVPPLLFGDIAVKRSTEELGKVPYYPPPQ